MVLLMSLAKEGGTILWGSKGGTILILPFHKPLAAQNVGMTVAGSVRVGSAQENSKWVAT